MNQGSTPRHPCVLADIRRRRGAQETATLRACGTVVRRGPGDDRAHAGQAGPAGRAPPRSATRPCGSWTSRSSRPTGEIAGTGKTNELLTGQTAVLSETDPGPQPRPRRPSGRGWRAGAALTSLESQVATLTSELGKTDNARSLIAQELETARTSLAAATARQGELEAKVAPWRVAPVVVRRRRPSTRRRLSGCGSGSRRWKRRAAPAPRRLRSGSPGPRLPPPPRPRRSTD